ncbi:MAG: UPF0175 family protein [Tepidisphaeraceae bacterium]
MSISFDLPVPLEQRLRRELGDLDVAAKQAALIELYRLDRLSHQELAEALGLDRAHTSDLLHDHGVVEDLPGADELEQDRQNLGRLLGPRG